MLPGRRKTALLCNYYVCNIERKEASVDSALLCNYLIDLICSVSGSAKKAVPSGGVGKGRAVASTRAAWMLSIVLFITIGFTLRSPACEKHPEYPPVKIP